MCILFIAYKQIEQYPLVIAANRDEFYQRPTAPSRFWPEHPEVLAGKDLQAGGTWMGITRKGKIAALTNVREPQNLNPDAVSRGALVTDFLTTKVAGAQYLSTLRSLRDRYNGYNLLFGTLAELRVYNNRSNSSVELTPGVHGLSNASLNSPWPKLTRGMQELKHYCLSTDRINTEALFTLLRNDEKAEDNDLPATGVSLQWERQLSAIFIRTPEYGTRTSTVLKISRDHEVLWSERTFGPQGNIVNEQEASFLLNPKDKQLVT